MSKAQIKITGLKINKDEIYIYPMQSQNISYWHKKLFDEGFDEISVAINVLDKDNYNTDGEYPITIYRDKLDG
jgi:hypothetical protein